MHWRFCWRSRKVEMLRVNRWKSILLRMMLSIRGANWPKKPLHRSIWKKLLLYTGSWAKSAPMLMNSSSIMRSYLGKWWRIIAINEFSECKPSLTDFLKCKIHLVKFAMLGPLGILLLKLWGKLLVLKNKRNRVRSSLKSIWTK